VGLNPDDVVGFFSVYLIFPSVSRMFRKCGILDVSEHCRPSQPVIGIALLYFISLLHFFFIMTQNKMFYCHCFLILMNVPYITKAGGFRMKWDTSASGL
jgi:hypothetical protein